MTKIAFVFPGQGAQALGMGRSLCEQFAVARHVFRQADEILGFSLSTLCFEGPEEELHQTRIAQPALLTHSIAALSVLEQLRPALHAEVFGGLSLGEYSAQVASGALSFEDALRAVSRRAVLMQEACEKREGGMVSIIGLTREQVETVLLHSGREGAWIANLNCPGQIVVSADRPLIPGIAAAAEASGAKMAIILKVAGAFHSPHMQEAADAYREFLRTIPVTPAPLATVLSNVTGKTFTTADDWVNRMSQQIVSPVLWEENLRFAMSLGVDCFYEIGTGKTLGGMLKRIDRKAGYVNVDTAAHAANLP